MSESWAVVADAPNQLGFRKIARRPIRGNEVLVQTEVSWISNGTEGSFIRGERIAGDTARREGDPLPFPHVPGYQSVGTVLEVGSDVTAWKVGDRVITTAAVLDDMFHSWGVHVSPAIHPADQLMALPEEIPAEAASGLVLTQVGVNTGMRGDAGPGDYAVVIGDGLVGHWTAQTLRCRGCRVALVGKHPSRLERDVKKPEDVHILATDPDWKEQIHAWSSGAVQVIAHTAGPIQPVLDLFPALKRNAHLVTAGFVGTEGLLDVQMLRDKELTLHAVSGWSMERMRLTLELLKSGLLQTQSLITHRFPASEAVEAFAVALGRSDHHLGVVLDWMNVPVE